MIQNIITTKFTISLIITTVVVVTIGTTIFTANAQQISSSSSSPTPPSTILQNITEVRVQKTVMSIPAPSANINNQTIAHQIVIALPLIEDGRFGPALQHLLLASL